MAEEHVKALFLNAEGVKSLAHLGDYMRNDGVMDCSEISVEGNYIEAKVKLRKDWGEKLGMKIEAHLLIPHRFVDLVVLDEVKNPMGFN